MCISEQQISHSSEFQQLFCILEHSRDGLFHRIYLLFLLDGLKPSLSPYPQGGCSVWQLIPQNEVLFPLCVFCPKRHLCPQEMAKHWKLSPVNTKRKNPPKLLALFSSMSCLDRLRSPPAIANPRNTVLKNEESASQRRDRGDQHFKSTPSISSRCQSWKNEAEQFLLSF